MSSQRKADRILEKWLADGPTGLPDHALETILSQLNETNQRGLTRLPGGTRMNGRMLALGGIAAVLVLMAVGVGLYFGNGNRSGVGGPHVTATPTAAATEVSGAVFTSERHGYQLRLPDETWDVQELAGEWPLGDSFNQEGPGSDSVTKQGADTGLILLNSQAVPNGTSLEQWATDYHSANREWFPDCAIERSETTVIDGDTARVDTYLCAETRAAEAATFHGGRAYVIRVAPPLTVPGADARPMLHDWVSRFQFTE